MLGADPDDENDEDENENEQSGVPDCKDYPAGEVDVEYISGQGMLGGADVTRFVDEEAGVVVYVMPSKDMSGLAAVPLSETKFGGTPESEATEGG